MRSKLAMLALSVLILIPACKQEEKVSSDTAATATAISDTAVTTTEFAVRRDIAATTDVEVRLIGMGLLDGVAAPSNPVTAIFPAAAGHQAFISVHKAKYSPALTQAMIDSGKALESRLNRGDGETYAQYTINAEEIGFKGIQDATLQYQDDGGLCPERRRNEHSLHWLPSLSKILNSAQTVSSTASRQPNGVNARMEISKGTLETVVRDRHVWDFKVNRNDQPVLRQALAGVLVYTFKIPRGENLTITSRPLSGTGTAQDLMTVKPDGNSILITIGNTLPDDRFERAVSNTDKDPHFAHYYDLLAMRPRSTPTPFRGAQECMAGSGGTEPGVTCGWARK